MDEAETLYDDKLNEECGIFGVHGADAGDAAALVALGLHALQHRGQEAAGIVSYDEETGEFYNDRRIGLVREIIVLSRFLASSPLSPKPRT